MMRFEREYDPRSLVLTGNLRHAAENDLVPQMHAVEVADRHHRVRAGIGDMFGAANDLHKWIGPKRKSKSGSAPARRLP